MATLFGGGLKNFISDIRACSSKEAEEQRVIKELAKLRNKFTQNQGLNSYDKKKYSWKLIYIYMLGYEIDFGHMQVINLLSSTKYSEKTLGYLGSSILLKNSDELMTLVVNSVRNDLVSADSPSQCLALSCISNMGGSQLCETLCGDVVQLFNSSKSIAHVRKKAGLCLRRIMQSNPDFISPEEVLPRILQLLDDNHLGVVTSVAGLLLTACSLSPQSYESVYDKCLSKLSMLVVHKSSIPDYMYYATPAPWLQIKLLQILQQLPISSNPETIKKLNKTLRYILTRPEVAKTAKNNAIYAILFEAVNLVVSQGKDSDPELRKISIELLGRFIGVKEPNIRYIGLDTMTRLIQTDGISPTIKAHQETVLTSLKDADNSVRRRALDLLFAMCDSDNALSIVNELVSYLTMADITLREEMVLKIAILAEKFAQDLRWYVNTVLRLITIAGSDVSDDIWHRVVQIVTNNESLQQYTADAMFKALEPKLVDETTIKFGAYILGEFGYLLVENEATNSQRQFDVLYQHFASSSVPTKCLILTAFIKMENLYIELRPQVQQIFEKCRNNVHIELQQRACEYFKLAESGSDTLKTVLEPMPVFPENRESALVLRLRKKEHGDDSLDDNDPTETEEPDLVVLDSPEKKVVSVIDGESAQRSPSPVSSMETIGIEQNLLPKMRGWFNKLVYEKQGILFENEYAQVGIKQEYKGAQGRINIFIGNKTDSTWSNVSCDVEQVDYLRVQTNPVEKEAAPRQQLKQQILVESLKPFNGAPKYQVSFDSNGAHHVYSLRLPIIVTSFMEPVALGAEDFIKRWKALEGHEREQQAIFNPTKPIDMSFNKAILTEKLHFSLADGADEDENSLSIASTFRTCTVNAQGNKISVGCLLRIEANLKANAYRLTVRAVHGDVSMAIKSIIVNLLS